MYALIHPSYEVGTRIVVFYDGEGFPKVPGKSFPGCCVPPQREGAQTGNCLRPHSTSSRHRAQRHVHRAKVETSTSLVCMVVLNQTPGPEGNQPYRSEDGCRQHICSLIVCDWVSPSPEAFVHVPQGTWAHRTGTSFFSPVRTHTDHG